MKRIAITLGLIGLTVAGCTYPISQHVRDRVDPSITFVHVLQAPQAYIGKTVILGGVISEIRNMDGVTELEVVEKDLDYLGYPSRGDKSLGRFIFRNKGYLEPEIFSKGREVTGAGTLAGVRKGKIGDTDYDFPVIDVEELKLWEKSAYPDYGYPPYYYGPYWRPFWRPYPFYAYRYYGRFYPYYYYW